MTTRTLLILMFLPACCIASASAQNRAPSYVNGTPFIEITDLGAPRITSEAPQLGAARQPIYTAQSNTAPRTSQLPVSAPSFQTNGYAPADSRPTLIPLQQPIAATSAPIQRPYAYGYGYTPVGCNYGMVPGYGNTIPPANYQAINAPVQPLVAAPQPFNPYAAPQNSLIWQPLIPIRSMPANYQVGQGIIGQPKVYVPSQPVRNFIRYITP